MTTKRNNLVSLKRSTLALAAANARMQLQLHLSAGKPLSAEALSRLARDVMRPL
jgi:hypothetical protein